MPRLGRVTLLGGYRLAGCALELGADEGGQGLRGGQAGDERHHRNSGQAASRRLAKRGLFAVLERLDNEPEQDKRRDVEAEQCADVVAFHQAKPNADAGEDEVRPWPRL